MIPEISMRRLRRYQRKGSEKLQIVWNVPEIIEGK